MEAIYLSISSNSLRQDWEFEYPALQLATAAGQQKAYRDSRITHWTKVKEGLMETVRSSGLQVNESLVEKMSYSTSNRSGGRRAVELTVDDRLQSDLDEAFGKIKEHTALSREYDAWIQVLTANPEAKLKLRHHDWMFFFGK